MSVDAGAITEAWQWLMTPLSGAGDHHIETALAWHGRFMVVAWGFVAPLMVVIARYYKVTPGQDWPRYLDNPFWFITHRRAGYAVGLLSICGALAISWRTQGFHFDWILHGTLGWSLLLLGSIQILGSLARGTHGGPVNPFTRKPRPRAEWPGDHFSMTRKRVFFEYTHKSLGWLLLVGSIVVVASGLLRADAPRWMALAMALWWSVAAAVVALLQMQGRCIDTYQAIWGLDPDLPGNKRTPIGWGITRRAAGGDVSLRKD